MVRAASTFVDNMSAPVHRWYRYSAGFSGQWVGDVLADQERRDSIVLLDPFAGSGTALLAADGAGLRSYGVEAHPFVVRVAGAKLLYGSDVDAYRSHAQRILACARTIVPDLASYPRLVRACFLDEALATLDQLRRAWIAVADGSPASELAWLTLVASLRQVAHVGTAPWQYVLPGKAKKQPLTPLVAFQRMMEIIAADMQVVGGMCCSRARLLRGDARVCGGVPDGSITLVITSPPYPNNYDYADATRLEMSFFQEVSGWGDLHDAVRRHLLCSCSHGASARAVDLPAVLGSAELAPIRGDLLDTCSALSQVRREHAGRKAYHLMVAAYFRDMGQVFGALRRVCATPSRLCFVVGDSAPYGVYVPVVEWLSALARAAGFEPVGFEKVRDRNTRWKNRKHRVPLCEGRLWLDG